MSRGDQTAFAEPPAAFRLRSRRSTGTLRPSVFETRRSLDGRDRDRRLARAIADAQAGGEAGFRFLYEQYADNVFSYVRTIVRDDHTAEDVTQHVFAKLLVKIGRYQPRSVPFAAWLLRISRNAAIDHMRKERTVACDEVMAVEPAHDDTAKDTRRELTEALRGLTHDQRQVLVLRHFLGLSPGEIATRLGKSKGAVHTLHHRARHSLRRELARRDSSIPVPGHVACAAP